MNNQSGIYGDGFGDCFEKNVQERGFVDNQAVTSTNPLTY